MSVELIYLLASRFIKYILKSVLKFSRTNQRKNKRSSLSLACFSNKDVAIDKFGNWKWGFFLSEVTHSCMYKKCVLVKIRIASVIVI